MQLDCSFASLLQAIGAIASLVWIYHNFGPGVEIIWNTLKDFFSRVDWEQRYGKWAVITGGSEGIGRRFVIHWAKKGLNIIIIARPDEHLHATAQEISFKYGVKVKTISVDFSNGWRLYNTLQKELSEYEIGVLVNNVGMLQKVSKFENIPFEQHELIVNVNINAAVMMSHLIIPTMKRQGKGLIINVASISCYTPVPYASMYAASKSFVYSFSKALKQELQACGVQVQTITSSVVATSLTQQLNPSLRYRLATVQLESFAKFLDFTIGKTEVTTGHWYHAIQKAASSLVILEARMWFFREGVKEILKAESSKHK